MGPFPMAVAPCWAQTGKGGVTGFTPPPRSREDSWAAALALGPRMGKGGEAGGVEVRVATEGMCLVGGHRPTLSKVCLRSARGGGSPSADTLGMHRVGRRPLRGSPAFLASGVCGVSFGDPGSRWTRPTRPSWPSQAESVPEGRPPAQAGSGCAVSPLPSARAP